MNSRSSGYARALLGAVLLAGCAGYRLTQPTSVSLDLTTPPPAGEAKICVMRPQSKVLSFTAAVRDNGNLVGATSGQSHFCYLAEPGEHLITTTVDRDTGEAQAVVAEGQSYYLEQLIDNGYMQMNIRQDWVAPEQAVADGRHSHYVVLAGVPRRQALPQIGMVAPAAPEDHNRTLRSSLPPSGG
jgi:hypothetical protein